MARARKKSSGLFAELVADDPNWALLPRPVAGRLVAVFAAAVGGRYNGPARYVAWKRPDPRGPATSLLVEFGGREAVCSGREFRPDDDTESPDGFTQGVLYGAGEDVGGQPGGGVIPEFDGYGLDGGADPGAWGGEVRREFRD